MHINFGQRCRPKVCVSERGHRSSHGCVPTLYNLLVGICVRVFIYVLLIFRRGSLFAIFVLSSFICF